MGREYRNNRLEVKSKGEIFRNMEMRSLEERLRKLVQKQKK